MCYHLTSTLPKGTNIEPLRPVIERYDMAFDPLKNPNLLSQFRSGELYFVTSKGHCDCGTVLGTLSTAKTFETVVQSKKAQKLRRKGWDEEKIAQWARDKIKSKKKSHGRKYTPQEINAETNRWIQFLRELSQTGNLSHVGLLKHWYSGSLETEQISIKRTEQINLADITTEILTKIEEDVLYEFINKKRKKRF